MDMTGSPDAVETRQLKNEINLVAFALIMYTLVIYCIAALNLGGRVLVNRLFDTPLTNRLLMSLDADAVPDILAAVLGTVVVFRLTRSGPVFSALFRRGKKMPFPVFVSCLCVLCAIQFASVWLDTLLEYCFNMVGLSLMESLEQATATSASVSAFLYTCVAAPVCEELVYRGCAMQRLKPCGRLFAIVISAVFFAVMHANLPQMLFAFAAGLLFGYVATEYSVLHAVCLHFVNNFLLGDLFDYACAPLPDSLVTLLFYFLFGTLSVCAVIVLLLYRKDIAAYIRENRSRKGAYRAAFGTALMIVFVAMNVALSLMLITPAGGI